MPSFEKSKSPEQENFDIFKQKYLQVLKNSNIPDIQKLMLRQSDILMLLGKLKPMTEIVLQGDIIKEWEKRNYWDDNSINNLFKVLKENFALSNSKISIEDEGKHAVYKVYDPEQIKNQIKKFPKLLPWDNKNNIKSWINDNLNSGVPIDYIYGALYGFPKSAIDFYLEKGNLMDVEFQGIGTYGEDYGVPKGELAPDVIAREKAKKTFFDMYENDQEIQDELKKTDDLYNELIQIRKQKIAELDAKDERLKK